MTKLIKQHQRNCVNEVQNEGLKDLFKQHGVTNPVIFELEKLNA